MPSLVQVTELVGVAADGAAQIAPAIAEKLSLDLPEIFGGNASKVAKLLGTAPQDMPAVSQLAHDFQGHLGRFGLPATATPGDLYEAATASGMKPVTLLDEASRGRTYSTTELAFDDGNHLLHSTSDGRKLTANMTAFLKKEQGVFLTHQMSNSVEGLSQSWELRTPSLRHAISHDWPF